MLVCPAMPEIGVTDADIRDIAAYCIRSAESRYSLARFETQLR
jgi:hypothetical protein